MNADETAPVGRREVETHPKDGWPLVAFPDAAAFEAWLEDHASDPTGLWLKIAKKDSGIPTVTYSEAVDVALCFGWIDGQKNAYDGSWFLQRFGPRRPRSVWSKVNTERVAALIAAGRMRPSGMAEVERARADGRWDAAYDRQGAATVPADLQEFLDANPQAAAFWTSLRSADRYAFLYRLQTAKRPETRARRLATYTAMLAAGESFSR